MQTGGSSKGEKAEFLGVITLFKRDGSYGLCHAGIDDTNYAKCSSHGINCQLLCQLSHGLINHLFFQLHGTAHELMRQQAAKK